MLELKLEKFLKDNFMGKKVEEKLIRDSLKIVDYDEYAAIITKLSSIKVVKGIKAQGNNGMIPPLYKVYQVEKEEKDYRNYIIEIKLLSTIFNIEDYIKRVEKYLNNRDWILVLDKFFKENLAELDHSLSINERSFQIFGKEKFLKENYTAIFETNPLLEKKLNFYKTPEPFFSYDLDTNKDRLRAIIFENKDTWYSFSRFLKEEKDIKENYKFDILIYGEGKKISRTLDSLTEYSEAKYKGKKIEYYYFGDLDFEGIKIYETIKKVNPKLEIRLMTEFYKVLINESKKITLPITKEKQSEILESSFYDELENEAHYIKEILKNRYYIPQELLNYKMIRQLGAKND